jgi:hypothetical protein
MQDPGCKMQEILYLCQPEKVRNTVFSKYFVHRTSYFVLYTGSVVQWIEWQIPVLLVVGSSPSGVTVKEENPCK